MSMTASAVRSQVRRDQRSVGYTQEDLNVGAPVAQRRSLPRNHQYGTRQNTIQRNRRPIQPDVADEEEQFMPKDTDDLMGEDARVTTAHGKVTPLRTRRIAGSYAQQQPDNQGMSKVKLVTTIFIVLLIVWNIVKAVLFIVDFCTDVSNTLAYGPNRTSVVSGVFGHSDSLSNPSYVVAMNVKGTLLLEAVPGGDVSKAKIYPTGLALIGDNASKLPIILTVKDLNGDHKPDVFVQIPGQGVTLKLINTGTGFTLFK